MLSTTTIDVERVAAAFDTVDAMETELQRLEGLISRVRARQVEILAAVDRLQVPAWDGCRSLKEWIAGRLDIQPRNAADLAVLAKSASAEVHHSLRLGLSSTDRAAGMARLANANAADEVMDRAEGVSVGQLGQLMARHRRMTPVEEATAYKARRLWFQPNLGSTLATGSFAMTGTDMEAVIAALDKRADHIVPNDEHRPRLEQRRVDALVSLALDDIAPVDSDKPAPRRMPALIFIDAAECSRTVGAAGATTRSGIKVGSSVQATRRRPSLTAMGSKLCPPTVTESRNALVTTCSSVTAAAKPTAAPPATASNLTTSPTELTAATTTRTGSFCCAGSTTTS